MFKDSKKEEMVKICPKCGSENIEIEPRIKTNKVYVCKECGFSSLNFTEIPKKWADELQKRKK
ncbi:MAG: hypothetical protein QXD55_01005 [Candidatus Aenigmatarchaeota archaeon]